LSIVLRFLAIATKVSLCAALIGLMLPEIGCRSCHDDHPYVPYAIEPSELTHDGPLDAAAPSQVAETSMADAGSDPFAGRASVEAPVGATSLVLAGVTVQAPPGLVLQRVLMGDPDSDVEKTAFAVVRSADGADPGEVVFYRGQAQDGSLILVTTLAPPPLFGVDAGCTPESRLLGVGKRSVLAELGVACAPTGSGQPARPTRYIAVIDAGLAAKSRFAVTVADPEGAAPLSVDAVVSDRDGDGRDDLALRVTLDGGGAMLEPGPSLSALSAWLDRPAGPSRDTGATEASFQALADWATSHASRVKDAPEVPGYVAHALALWRATCAESGVPRVVAVVGAGITCNVPHALEGLGLAEVRAFASIGQPLQAALALTRAERPPASRTPSRAVDALKWISQKAPVASARLVRKAAAVPAVEPGREPSWGPLAFELSGKLLIRTRAGVVRLDADLGDEASSGSVDWKPSVTSPDGTMTWVAVNDDCDGLALRAAFEPKAGGDRREVALPLGAPLGDRCPGGRAGLVQGLPVAWGPRGLEAIVDGELVLISPDLTQASLLAGFVDEPATLGAPRSPDGKAYVVPTEVGFLVQSEAGTRLLRASELDGTYGEQEHCVVSNDTTHVACVHLGLAWAGTWDAPGAAP
jgi:hypothetical protein